jgi:hypothetical protein
MRVLLIVAWLFTGLGGAIYHFGPGQEKLKQDRVAELIAQARLQVENRDWKDAVDSFNLVLSELPGNKVAESRSITLEKAKAQMMAAQLPDARQSLEILLADAKADNSTDPRFLQDVQSTLANSQYYTTWLMRLEGMKEEEWMPEIESARQHYLQLAHSARKSGDSSLLDQSLENLESAIRLARMDLSELQALPLPSQ